MVTIPTGQHFGFECEAQKKTTNCHIHHKLENLNWLPIPIPFQRNEKNATFLHSAQH